MAKYFISDPLCAYFKLQNEHHTYHHLFFMITSVWILRRPEI